MYEDSDENLAGFLARAKGRASSPPWRLLADARRPTPTKRLPNGGAEYAADTLEGAAFGAAREVVERAGPPRAIGVASMAESGFLLGGTAEPWRPR